MVITIKYNGKYNGDYTMGIIQYGWWCEIWFIWYIFLWPVSRYPTHFPFRYNTDDTIVCSVYTICCCVRWQGVWWGRWQGVWWVDDRVYNGKYNGKYNEIQWDTMRYNGNYNGNIQWDTMGIYNEIQWEIQGM